MDKSSLIIALVSPVVSSASAIILFVLSSHRDTRKNKYDVYRERIDKIYAPYYTKLLYCIPKINELNNMPQDVADIYFNMITDNIYYLGTETQKLYKSFSSAYFDKTRTNSLVPKLTYDKKFATQFIIISESILKEYKYLCKKLKLEPPIEIF